MPHAMESKQARSQLAAEFAEAGVVQVRSVLSEAEVTHVRDVFTEHVERDSSLGYDDGVPPEDVLAAYPRLVHPHRRPGLDVGRVARRWMLEPRILRIVTELIGEPLAAQSMFYFKPPAARGQSMHQDNAFLLAHPETCLAAWVAIDDCDEDNGALKVVPGSHRYELICLDNYKPADPETSFSSSEIVLPAQARVVQTEMRAGDVLFFHGRLVHGSEPNRTKDRFRRSLIFHYVPRESTQIAQFYNPLLTPSGDEVTVAPAAGGGACGEGWKPPADS